MQEGSYNIDINADTVDGNNTFHSLARVEAPRRTNEFDKNKSCYNGKRATVDDIWIITKLLFRDVIVFPIYSQIMIQPIPFWTGLHYVLLEKRPDVAVVAYPSIIDAISTNMSTVTTAMKRCLYMPMDAGQEDTIQAFDQQHYAIAQLVKWSMSGIFELHIFRLCGFHCLSTFALSKL